MAPHNGCECSFLLTLDEAPDQFPIRQARRVLKQGGSTEQLNDLFSSGSHSAPQ
jgi:hypothetical protein